MKVGQYIVFKLDTWSKNKHKLVIQKSRILSFFHDPLGFHESKCTVEVNGEGYGIPFSEVLEVQPADNEQLTLF